MASECDRWGGAFAAVLRRLRSDTRGAVTVEYLVIVGTVALGLAVALASLGPMLMNDYNQTRAVIAAPAYPE